MTQVFIGPRTCDLADVLENPVQYARVLEQAKTIQGFAECGCTGSAPRPKLVIRRHRSVFILARWPEFSVLHREGCAFHQRKRQGDRPAEPHDAFQLRDGVHDVRLDVSLRISTVPSDASAPRVRNPSAAPGSQRRTASLLAFLEYAWEEASLHGWPGHGHRGWGACWSMLSAEFAGGHIGGQPAEQVLHVIRRWEPAHRDEILAEFDTFLNGLRRTQTAARRGLVIGELEAIKPTQYGAMLMVRQTRQRFFVSAALLQNFERSCEMALTGLQNQHLRCVVVMAIEKTRSGNLQVVDLAAMLANAQFVPCDSAYEAVMADHLIKRGRAFEKPMRHVDQTAVHPDFVLTDCAEPTVIEVQGMMDSPVYAARMAEKRAHYQSQGVRLVEWKPPQQAIKDIVLPIPTKSVVLTS